jgi:RNA polymerase sigma-70 factor (ECF subfamily)
VNGDAFGEHRRELTALAYRMLGDFGRAEDVVQEAWLRWQRQGAEAQSPKAFLITVVTRLCLNELGSARARREETRADRLPEPVNLDESSLGRLEKLEQISMAFLVLLQRLTPAERAVLVLHEVFDFGHDEIASLVGSTSAASRKLLERAKKQLVSEKRTLLAPPEEHRRLFQAFVRAATAGDVEGLAQLLAEDAVLITDGGKAGRTVAGQSNLRQPLYGASRIAHFVAITTARAQELVRFEERTLNGQPAIVLWLGDQPFAAILIAVAEGKIRSVFFHANIEHLRHV